MALTSSNHLNGGATAAATDFLDEVVLKGAKVWFQNSDRTWSGGELKTAPDADSDGTVSVLDDVSGKTIYLKLSQLVPANPKLQEGIKDLTHLSYLNEPGILHNLDVRYHSNEIYTLAGPVLIAVNPCKSLPLYTPEVANAYKAGARDVVHNLPPHIYLVAANAFRKMLREKQNQSLIVNGESGAGKTETTKKAMQYFATLAGGTGVEDQVLETNPVLEAFGNAKTLRNHNSSRFGKLIQIFFNKGNHICGARIKTYLLEKSRVIHQLKGERSFHIFYQLVKGATPEEKKTYRLPDSPASFRFLNQSGCMEIDSVDDAEEFKIVRTALKDVGVDAASEHAIFSLLAGLLWLGNIEFMPNEADMANDSTHVKNNEALDNACALLGLSKSHICSALTQKRIITPSEIITKLLNMEDSQDCRDSLAKAIYSSVFNFVVECINKKLDTGKSQGCLSISILDIYGFEQFAKNSFEQLCINYANERLQQQFTRHLFTLEQQEYEAEGIDWTKVEFVDNQLSLDVIEMQHPKGLGVLAVLDDQCRFPKASDETFCHKLKEQLTGHSHFDLPRQGVNAQKDFIVVHYAGGVQYTCDGFLDKNKDTLNIDLIDLMCDGHNPLLSSLGESLKADTDSKQRGGQTVGGCFSAQLKDLVNDLDTTGLHFVRCIKPNSSLKPDLFEAPMTLHQLRCCGVLEVARIARAGFPTRYTHSQFADRYIILLSSQEQAAVHGANSIEACRELLSKFGLTSEQYQLGKTKVFFRPGVLGYVEDLWARMQAAVLKIQAFWRMCSARIKFRATQRSALALQSLYRSRVDRLAFVKALRDWRAAIVVQTEWRAHAAYSGYQSVRRAVWTIQMAYRRYRFNLRVWHRVYERQEKERLVKVEQESFVSLRNTYGCDLDEVHAAMTMWRSQQTGQPYSPPPPRKSTDGGADSFTAAAGAVGAGTVLVVSTATDDHALASNGTCTMVSPTSARARSVEGVSSSGAAVAAAAVATAGASAAVNSAHMYESTRELAEKLEKLQLENMRLQKAVLLERSLKERYQRKFEDQNANWLEQIKTLQMYIVQVRSAYGGHRLPPLPVGLFEPSVTPTRASSIPAITTASPSMAEAEAEADSLGAAEDGDAAPIADDPMDLSPAVSPGQVTEGSSRGVAGGMEPLSAASTVPMDGIEKNAEIASVAGPTASNPSAAAAVAVADSNGTAIVADPTAANAATIAAAAVPVDCSSRVVDAGPTTANLSAAEASVAAGADAAASPADADAGPARASKEEGLSKAGMALAGMAGVAAVGATTAAILAGTHDNNSPAASMTAAAAATAAEAVPPGVDQPSEKSVTPGSTAAAASTTAATAAMASNIRSGRGAHVSRHKAPLDPQSYMMHGDEEEEERLANAAASASANQAGPSQPAGGALPLEAGATPVALQHLWRPQKMPPISPVAAVVPGGGAPANMVIQQATPSQRYVDQLTGELNRVSQVLADDVDFISEVKHGLAEAHEMDPNMELNKLKKKFEIWKREFKEKLKTTEDVLKKIDKLGGTASASRRYTGSSQGVQTSSSRPSAQTLQPSPNWTVDRASTPSASGTGAASMEPSPNQVVSPPRTNSTPRNPSMSSRASQPPSSRASSSSSVAPPPGSGSRASQPPAKRKGSGFMSSLFK